MKLARSVSSNNTYSPSSWNTTVSNKPSSLATIVYHHHALSSEASIDAYAQSILTQSAGEMGLTIDDSLGAYVTSLLRISGTDDLTQIPDLDDLVELLQEHCGLSTEAAQAKLQDLAILVVHGGINNRSSSLVATTTKNHSELIPTGLDSMFSLQTALPNNQDSSYAEVPVGSLLQTTLTKNISSGTILLSPTHADGLLPFDLLEEDAVAAGMHVPTISQKNCLRYQAQPGGPTTFTPVMTIATAATPLIVADENDFPPLGSASQQPTPPRRNRRKAGNSSGANSTSNNGKNQKEQQQQQQQQLHPDKHAAVGSMFNSPISWAQYNKSEETTMPEFTVAAIPFHQTEQQNHQQQALHVETSPSLTSCTSQEQQDSLLTDTYYCEPPFEVYESVADILLGMNVDLSPEAAYAAAVLANTATTEPDPHHSFDTTLHTAQYILDTALAAPPICRHLLQSGCYRSDCQYSHDIQGHTCVFWLQGRCGKGDECRFLHGFHDKVLLRLADEQHQQHPSQRQDYLYHDRVRHPYHPLSHEYGLAMTDGGVDRARHDVTFIGNVHNGLTMTPTSNWKVAPPTGLSVSSVSSASSSTTIATTATSASTSSGGAVATSKANSNGTTGITSVSSTQPKASSFANVATQGYVLGGSFGSSSSNLQSATSASSTTSSSMTVRIPQDLWHPHENRESGVFHIPDPMERYRQVMRLRNNSITMKNSSSSSSSYRHMDVIDLHYQSTKTFVVVLEEVLPTKLAMLSTTTTKSSTVPKMTTTSTSIPSTTATASPPPVGIWIVTGTGHHVGTRTHQKSGGLLENAVMDWLDYNGYRYHRGRDRNGQGGALLVLPVVSSSPPP